MIVNMKVKHFTPDIISYLLGFSLLLTANHFEYQILEVCSVFFIWFILSIMLINEIHCCFFSNSIIKQCRLNEIDKTMALSIAQASREAFVVATLRRTNVLFYIVNLSLLAFGVFVCIKTNNMYMATAYILSFGLLITSDEFFRSMFLSCVYVINKNLIVKVKK